MRKATRNLHFYLISEHFPPFRLAHVSFPTAPHGLLRPSARASNPREEMRSSHVSTLISVYFFPVAKLRNLFAMLALRGAD
jgi:hypothetical protein